MHGLATPLAIVCLLAAIGGGRAMGNDPAPPDTPLQGLWAGSWGGGERDGTVVQPVLAEMVVDGDRIEIDGFPGSPRMTGTLRIDAANSRLELVPTLPDPQRVPGPLTFRYAIDGGRLTLDDGRERSVTLHRYAAESDAIPNVALELVTATGINEEGELLVTRHVALRTATFERTFYRPSRQALSTSDAAILLVGDAETTAVALDEARRRLAEPTLVAVCILEESRSPHPRHVLWSETDPPAPDDPAARSTLLRALRPGTLVFVLPPPPPPEP